MENRIKQCEEDVNELKDLLNRATRENVINILNTQLDKWQAELTRLRLEQDRLTKLAASSSTNTQATGFTKKIETFGWDQSEKFVKIYITSLNDLNKVKDTDIVSNFTEKSMDVTIRNLNNINYNMTFANLSNKIVPSESYVKLKTDMVTIFLKKAEQGKQWSDVTPSKSKDSTSAPKFDENADPQEGLMSLMKKMYEEGDDEMKRTISKAFTESREKSMRGGGDQFDMPAI